jgi:hypothetical protein
MYPQTESKYTSFFTACKREYGDGICCNWKWIFTLTDKDGLVVTRVEPLIR